MSERTGRQSEREIRREEQTIYSCVAHSKGFEQHFAACAISPYEVHLPLFRPSVATFLGTYVHLHSVRLLTGATHNFTVLLEIPPSPTPKGNTNLIRRPISPPPTDTLDQSHLLLQLYFQMNFVSSSFLKYKKISHLNHADLNEDKTVTRHE